MNNLNLNQRRPGEKGESNAKFIAVLVVLAIVIFVVYNVLPIYYKEQQLRHDVKEEVRVSAVNGRTPEQVDKNVRKIVDNIDFKEDVKCKAGKKGDTITVNCSGTIPIDFIVYQYKYEIKFAESFNRGGY